MKFKTLPGSDYPIKRIGILTFLLVQIFTLTAIASVIVSPPVIEGVDGKTKITIPLSAGEATFGKVESLKNVIYLDIEDATAKSGRMMQTAEGGAVTKVIVSQFQTSPTLKSRIVVHFTPDIAGKDAVKVTTVAMEGKAIAIVIDNAMLGKTGTPMVKPAVGTSPAAPVVPPPPPPVAAIDRPVTVTFSDADLLDVIRALAAKSELNIYAGPDVKGKVTIQVQNEPVGRVLNNILEINGYKFETITDNSVRVVEKPGAKPPPPPPPPGPVTKIFAIDYASASEIETAVSKLLKVDSIQTFQSPSMASGDSKGRTQIVAGAGTLIITAPADVMTQIEQLIRKLDQPIKQVMIDVRIVSMQIETNKDIGVGWDVIFGGRDGSTNVVGGAYIPGAGNLYPSLTTAIGLITDPISAGEFTNANNGNFIIDLFNDNKSITAALTAMIETEKADLLANPKLLALNNTVSKFDLTEKIPYLEFQLDQQTNTLTGEIKEKEAGIKLEITPQITSDGHIMMKLIPDQLIRKGEIQFQTAAGAPLTSVPIIDQRKTEAQVRLKDGQTLVIGGLRRKDEIINEAKIPWLSDLPILGNLFKTKNTLTTKTELVIFVTPYIIPDDAGLSTEEKMMYDRVDFF